MGDFWAFLPFYRENSPYYKLFICFLYLFIMPCFKTEIPGKPRNGLKRRQNNVILKKKPTGWKKALIAAGTHMADFRGRRCTL